MIKKTKQKERDKKKKLAFWMNSEGYTSREIGSAVGRSHVWVAKILKEEVCEPKMRERAEAMAVNLHDKETREKTFDEVLSMQLKETYFKKADQIKKGEIPIDSFNDIDMTGAPADSLTYKALCEIRDALDYARQARRCELEKPLIKRK